MAKLTTIEGIGTGVEKKLKKAGVGSTHTLLKLGGTKKGRKELAAATKIDEAKLLRYVNHADLMRVRGIGKDFSELLEAAGVDSVPELKRRNAANLRAAMEEKNNKRRKNKVKQLPTEKQVTDWVAQAKKLGRAVSH